MTIRIVCATTTFDNKLLFGYKDQLPWVHLKEDLQSFKKSTLNTTLYMGSNTFKSLPGILPGRKHIVISNSISDITEVSAKDGSHPNEIVNNLSVDFLNTLKDDDNIHSFIGGVGVIELVLPFAQEIYYTEIKSSAIKNKVLNDSDNHIYLNHLSISENPSRVENLSDLATLFVYEVDTDVNI